MPTRLDVIHRALRDLGVTAHDEAATADEAAYAGQTLDALFAEIQVSPGLTFDFTLSGTVPESHFLPLSWCLSARLPNYGAAPPKPWTSALMELKAVNNPYARNMDLNDDDTTTDEEVDDFDRGGFF